MARDMCCMDCCRVSMTIFTQMHRKSLVYFSTSERTLAAVTEQHWQLCLKYRGIYTFVHVKGPVKSIDGLLANPVNRVCTSNHWPALLRLNWLLITSTSINGADNAKHQDLLRFTRPSLSQSYKQSIGKCRLWTRNLAPLDKLHKLV